MGANRQQRRVQAKQAQDAAKKGQLSPEQQQILQQGFLFFQQGNIQDAEALYRHILASQPKQPDALYLMGMLAQHVQRPEIAETYYRQALAVYPKHIDAWARLAGMLQGLQHTAKAESVLVEGLKHNPSWTEGYMQLAALHEQCDNKKAAEKTYRDAIKTSPARMRPAIALAVLLSDQNRAREALDLFLPMLDDPACEAKTHVHNNLAVVYSALKQWDKALEHSKQALALEPESSDQLNNLANIALSAGNNDEIDMAHSLMEHNTPSNARSFMTMGFLCQHREEETKALEWFTKAINADAALDDAYISRAAILQRQGKLIEAKSELEGALQRFPNHLLMHMNLGTVCKDMGNNTEALAHFRHVFEQSDAYPYAHSNYLFTMHYEPTVSPEDIAAASRKFGERYAPVDKQYQTFPNDRNPARRLRIGYVSGDFHAHPVHVYIEPVLASHDKQAVEVFCYHNGVKNDEVTARLKSHADHWRSIQAMSDDDVCELIRNDAIDILIDLSGHTASHRLLVFGRKPSPIQATWIGYFNTTGIAAMDYIITDRYLLPPEEEYLYTEKPLRLPSNGACYKLPKFACDVTPLPALTNGFVTFGCFTARAKVTPEVLELWVDILKRIPTSRLVLKNKSFDESSIQDEQRAFFTTRGIAAERLRFEGQTAMIDYMRAYNAIDMCLDPFPYNAATTTLDALWMGVPMITLKGDRLVAHIGESMLAAVGLHEFVAGTKEEYIEKAIYYAEQLERLQNIRRTLRPTLEATPMTNPKEFTQGLETALRMAWKQWCEKDESYA